MQCTGPASPNISRFTYHSPSSLHSRGMHGYISTRIRCKRSIWIDTATYPNNFRQKILESLQNRHPMRHYRATQSSSMIFTTDESPTFWHTTILSWALTMPAALPWSSATCKMCNKLESTFTPAVCFGSKFGPNANDLTDSHALQYTVPMVYQTLRDKYKL